MKKEHRIKDFVEAMLSSDPANKAAALSSFAMKPSGDPRVLPYIETHLYDTTMCIIGVPTQYAEIRFLAAQALVAECRQQNVKRSILLHDLVCLLDDSDLITLYLENKMQRPKNVDWLSARLIILEELHRLGKLPTEDVEIDV